MLGTIFITSRIFIYYNSKTDARYNMLILLILSGMKKTASEENCLPTGILPWIGGHFHFALTEAIRILDIFLHDATIKLLIFLFYRDGAERSIPVKKN